jgi:hypothetical protein
MNLIPRNADMLLGLLAWVVASTSYHSSYFVFYMTWWGTTFFFLVPVLWTILAIAAIKRSKRPRWHLWWIWPSAPVAFFAWAYVGFLLYATIRSGVR